jgi:sulfur carrier protein ThiS
MKERFAVSVNGKPVEVFRGMSVKHALIAYGYPVYKACAEGRAVVRDEHGFIVGLEGSLREGAALHVDMDKGDV